MGSRFLAIAITLFTLCSTVLGQTNLVPLNFTANWNPTGDGCVDASGFLSCYASQGSKAATCKAACEASDTKGSSAYNTCANLCEVSWLGDNLGCWIQSCWNQVYSCAYQLAALSYFDGTGTAQNSDDVPFYPPPSDASAGACSCNLGYVYGQYSAVSTSSQGSSCEVIAGGNGGSGTDNSTFYDCECCSLSWPVSNILNTCPTSDLSVVNLNTFITQVEKSLSPSTDKCSILTNGSDTCVKDYNFPWLASSSAYNPLALPTGVPGKDPLSNTVGNAFTVFPTQAPFALTLGASYTSTITPAAFAATASADSQSIVGTSVLGKPTTTPIVAATRTSSTPAATSKSSSSGLDTERNPLFLLLAVGLAVAKML